MVLSQPDDYILSFSFDEECMITGKDLPHHSVKIDTDYHYIVTSLEGIDYLKNLYKNNVDDKNVEDFIIGTESSVCCFCERFNNCLVVSDYREYPSPVCIDCLEEIRNIYKNFIEEGIFYSDPNLFKVIDYSKGRKFLDAVSMKSRLSTRFFVFVDESDGFYCDFNNIGKLREMLSRPDEYDSIYYINKINEDQRICHRCRNRCEVGIGPSSCFLCLKCRDIICHELDRFIERHKKWMVTKGL